MLSGKTVTGPVVDFFDKYVSISSLLSRFPASRTWGIVNKGSSTAVTWFFVFIFRLKMPRSSIPLHECVVTEQIPLSNIPQPFVCLWNTLKLYHSLWFINKTLPIYLKLQESFNFSSEFSSSENCPSWTIINSSSKTSVALALQFFEVHWIEMLVLNSLFIRYS